MENKAKEIKLNSANKQEGTEPKYTMEDLKKMCIQLDQERQYLLERLKQADYELTAKRLDYLFKVVEFKESFSKKFTLNCTQEIEEILSFKEESNTEETKENVN